MKGMKDEMKNMSRFRNLMHRLFKSTFTLSFLKLLHILGNYKNVFMNVLIEKYVQ